MNEAPPKIYKAISDVMADIGAVGKNQRNQQQGFMFRGIDAVMNAINPALIKHHVFVVPEILEQSREERTTKTGSHLIYSICKIKYTFYAEDGSNITAITIGEGMDSGDKATNKAMAIAFKYACFQVFCIPTEEMKDPDEECHEVRGKTSEKENKPSRGQTTGEPRYIDEQQNIEIMNEIIRTGITMHTILSTYGLDRIEDMTDQQYRACMKKFSATPTKGART